MKRPRPDEGEEFQYALRVLKMPPGPNNPPSLRTMREPPEVLIRAMELADREYHRLLDTIDAKYYHEFAVPAHVEIESGVARDIKRSLRMRQLAPGVLGPEALAYREGVYKVWIEVFPCG